MKRTAAFMLLVLALLALPIMAWAGATKSDYNWQQTGHLMFYDGATYETYFGTFPTAWGDDFSAQNATSNSTTLPDPWEGKIINTGALVRNATSPAMMECNTNYLPGAAAALLYWGDEARVYTGNEPVVEMRVNLPVLGNATNGTGAWWGVGGSWAGGSTTASAFVGFTYNSTDGLKFRNWNSTNQLNSTVSAASITADTWAIYRLDFTDLSNVRGFVNGVEVTDGTQSWSYTGDLQPIFYANKTTAGSMVQLQVDYARFWQNR